MALLKKLQIGNNEIGKYTKDYLLTDYQCHTCRHHNEQMPNADKYCERIDLTIVAPGREDVRLYQWFIAQAPESGRILIELPPNANQDGEKKEVQFENAIVYSLEEEFHFNIDRVRKLKLSIVAEQVKISGVKFNRI
ncbi:MAG: hypothetical protein IJ618_06860 [Prevotella sp.]|nr:hypothetical protein [Prevotella sp.]MBR1503583.1 hypothetical protein [Prevotella sp.]